MSNVKKERYNYEEYNMEKLPREYFELIKDTLKDERNPKRQHIETSSFIATDSPSSNDEDDYDSEEFEDVTLGPETSGNDSVQITLDPKRNTQKIRANVVDLPTKQSRKFIHAFYLLCMIVHGNLRNQWLNDVTLQKKLSKLVPNKVYENLHPVKDNELPIILTRKLIDSLKHCMNIWNKFFKIMNPEYDNGLYQWSWSELKTTVCNNKNIDRSMFKEMILNGYGPMSLSIEGFIAMLRGCNINARFVISIQPPDLNDMKPISPSQTNTNNINNFHEKSKYPIMWCEVWDRFSKNWITIDPVSRNIIEQVRFKSKLEPAIGKYSRYNNLRYVVGFDRKLGCRDITRRYCQQFQSKTRRKRITRDTQGHIWYEKIFNIVNQRKRTKIDDYEDLYFRHRDEMEGIPNSLQDLKNHPKYILEQNLKFNQVLKPESQQCGFLKLKNRDKSTKTIKVFQKKDVLDLYSARHWFMLGRILKVGAKSLKVKNIKNLKTGEQENERLYSIHETKLYVPPSVQNGKIPINAYGNIDIYRPWMIPEDCCLVESSNSIRAANFIEIPYAKAVTSFKFEKGHNVKPQITGVVIQKKHCDALISMINGIEYYDDIDEKCVKELNGLKLWSMLLKKLAIKTKLNRRHGNLDDVTETDNMVCGGFLVEDQITEHIVEDNVNEDTSPITNMSISTPQPYEKTTEVKPSYITTSTHEHKQDSHSEYKAFMQELSGTEFSNE